MCVQGWARTPLWKRAEYMHKVDGLMKANAQPMADCLVVEVRTPSTHQDHHQELVSVAASGPSSRVAGGTQRTGVLVSTKNVVWSVLTGGEGRQGQPDGGHSQRGPHCLHSRGGCALLGGGERACAAACSARAWLPPALRRPPAVVVLCAHRSASVTRHVPVMCRASCS